MMVANSFDLWQKDHFFSAAEEVQGSADTMESAYRKWIRERREGVGAEKLDELCSELQIALGTAKWQCEEFERAVNLSSGYGSNRCEDTATYRHREFTTAIEDQISRVETALREFFNEQGKEPFHWVHLDEEERDDLAAFLSGDPSPLKTSTDGSPSVRGSTKGKEVELDSNTACSRNTCDALAVDKGAEHVVEIEANEMSETREDVICQVDRATGARKTWVLAKFSDLKVAVPDDAEENKPMQTIEATPKEKGYKPPFWRVRCFGYPQAPLMGQLLGRVGGSPRQSHNPHRLQLSSVQFTLILMLTIFLIGKHFEGHTCLDMCTYELIYMSLKIEILVFTTVTMNSPSLFNCSAFSALLKLRFDAKPVQGV